MLTWYVSDKAHTCLHVFVIQWWQNMLVTENALVSTRLVCRTIMTEYVGDKAHAGFYTPWLSYNADRVCWWQSGHRFLHAVFVVQCWQSMLVTKHTYVSTRLVGRTILTEYVHDKEHAGFYTQCLSYNADRVCWLQSTYIFLHALLVVQYWQSMLMTKHIQVSTRSVCRAMLTDYVGDKAHTSFYTPCLSYNTDSSCWGQSTHRFPHAVFVVQCLQIMLVTNHIQVFTRRVCRTMLTELLVTKHIQVSTRRVCRTTLTVYVCDKAHTCFYTPCLSYNADRVCCWQSTYIFLHALFVVQCWQSMLVTKHIQVSARSVCLTILTEYVGDKAHTGVYTQCLSYNADRVCWWQSTHRFLHAVFIVQYWRCMLVTKHTHVSTRRVCRTILTVHVDVDRCSRVYHTMLTEYMYVGVDRHRSQFRRNQVNLTINRLNHWVLTILRCNNLNLSMLVTKLIQVSTRHVCRTMLTEYVGNKEHTGFYTPCLSYNADRVWCIQNTHRFLHAVFNVQCWQSMLVTKNTQVSTRRVCRTMLTEYVCDKAQTCFYTPCLSYNADRVCWWQSAYN